MAFIVNWNQNHLLKNYVLDLQTKVYFMTNLDLKTISNTPVDKLHVVLFLIKKVLPSFEI